MQYNISFVCRPLLWILNASLVVPLLVHYVNIKMYLLIPYSCCLALTMGICMYFLGTGDRRAIHI